MQKRTQAVMGSTLHLTYKLLINTNAIAAQFTIDNPKYQEALKFGRFTGGIEKHLCYYETDENGLHIPRGATRRILDMLRNGIPLDIVDNRLALPDIKLQFTGDLRPYQTKAVNDLLQKDFGVLEAGTGSGKTVCGLAMIAKRKQPTIVIVHTKELMYQWQQRAKTFLGADVGLVGLVGGGKYQPAPITIGIVNSVRQRLPELSTMFGHLIVDECHRVPATLFTETVSAFPTKYMLGLSATPYRKDGLDKLIGWFMGEHRVKVSMQELQSLGAILRPEIIQRETDFSYYFNDDYSTMVTALARDTKRNAMIAGDVDDQARRGGLSLVVSDRVEHLETIADMTTTDHAILTGKTTPKRRREIVEQLNRGEIPVLYSTTSLIGEGFDCPSMDALFITSPIKFSGRLKQVVGRVLRPDEGKHPIVYDYTDSKVGVLKYQASCRQQVYQTM